MRKKKILTRLMGIGLAASISLMPVTASTVYGDIATRSELERVSDDEDEDTDEEEYIDEEDTLDAATPSEIGKESKEDTKDTVATPSEIEKPDELECPNGITLKKQTLKASVGGYTVTAYGLIPEGAKLQVKNIKHAEQYEDIINEQSHADTEKKFKAVKALDIEIIMEDGEPYQPLDFSETVKITVKGDEIKEDKDLEVYRISDDESEIDALAATGTEEKTAEFETEHFTTFVLGTTEYDVSDDWIEEWNYETNGDEVTIKYYQGTETELIVPGTAEIGGNTYKVVINQTAFPDNATSVIIDSEVIFRNTAYLFRNSSALTSVNIQDWDLSNVTDMKYMFYGCTALTDIDFTGVDTSHVTDMRDMFSYSGITSVSGLDTSSVTDMNHMFYGCYGLTELDLSDWDTSNVTDMSYMFSGCYNITSLDINSWNTSSVQNMNSMFARYGLENDMKLEDLDISSWNTSSVTDMGSMFIGCESLTTLDLSGWDVSNVTDMSGMFAWTGITTAGFEDWETSSLQNMNIMFEECSFPSLDLSGWDVSHVTDLTDMLKMYSLDSEVRLREVDLSGWELSSVTDTQELNSKGLYKVKTPSEYLPNDYDVLEFYPDDGIYLLYEKSSTNPLLLDMTQGYTYLGPEETLGDFPGTPLDTWLYIPVKMQYYDKDENLLFEDYVPYGEDVTDLHQGTWYTTKWLNTAADLTNVAADGNAEMNNLGDYFIYKVYGEKTYTIKFDPNGGSGTAFTQTKKTGETFTVPSADFTSDDKVVVGWSTEPDGTGTVYTPGTEASLDVFDEEVIFYAVYGDPSSFKGSFTVSMPAVILMTYDGDTKKIHAESEIAVSGNFQDGDYVNVAVDNVTITNDKNSTTVDVTATSSKTKWTKNDLTVNSELALTSPALTGRTGWYHGDMSVVITSGNE